MTDTSSGLSPELVEARAKIDKLRSALVVAEFYVKLVCDGDQLYCEDWEEHVLQEHLEQVQEALK